MFERFREKQLRLKQLKTSNYESGYRKAEERKNEEIRKLKIRYAQIIRDKNETIAQQSRKVRHIEAALNQHSDIVAQTNMIIKKIKSNSYAHAMLIHTDHQKIETMNDEIETIELKISKSKNKLDGKIIEFRKTVNE